MTTGQSVISIFILLCKNGLINVTKQCLFWHRMLTNNTNIDYMLPPDVTGALFKIALFW